MKDLLLTKADGTLQATLRVEMINNNDANFNILEIKDSTGAKVDSVSLIGAFYNRAGQVSLPTFIAFCKTNNLKITSRDTNGSNASVLLINQPPSGTKYPIVSATASTKTFLVATDVTGSFAASNHVVVYNADNTIWQAFTEASDSYSAPNTSIVMNEVVTGGDIPVSSGKYLVNNL